MVGSRCNIDSDIYILAMVSHLQIMPKSNGRLQMTTISTPTAPTLPTENPHRVPLCGFRLKLAMIIRYLALMDLLTPNMFDSRSSPAVIKKKPDIRLSVTISGKLVVENIVNVKE